MTGSPSTPLCSVALDRAIAGEKDHDLARKWTEVSPRGTCCAIRSARTRLRLVTRLATMAPATAADDGVELTLASEIVDFAFSQCGEFLAVAGANGVLHLFKSESARELFAYPIVAPSAAANDSIQAVVFAARAAGLKKEEPGVEIPEDLLVLTRAGVLIRLGNLRLAEIERTLAREASHNMALRAIMASMQLQQANVGRLRDGAKSVLLARRYPSSLFVTVGNHSDALSVWRVDTSGRQKEASSIRRHAAYSDLVDGTDVSDVQFALRDRCLAVLSAGGSLTWWDWRGLVLLYEMPSESVSAFTVLEHHTIEHTSAIEEQTCVVALIDSVRSESNTSQIQVVQVQHLSASRTLDIVSTLDIPAEPTAAFVDMTTHQLATGELRLLVTQVGEETAEISSVGLHSQDDGADDMEVTPVDPHAISVGARCRQELYALDFASLKDVRAVVNFEEKVKSWIGGIGQELEDSRLIVESLVDFAKRLRQAQTSSNNNLPHGLEERLPNWLDQIASISYRWTTFTLLLSTVITSDANSRSLVSRWREFCTANLLDVMCAYLRRGMMRPVRLLWQRHTQQDALQHIDSILDSVPHDLPFSAYENWLQGDVVPGIVKHVERQTNLPSSGAANVISNFASWTAKRIHYYAERGDIDTALKLCYLLKPNDEHARMGPSTEMSLQWVYLRLLAPSTDSSENPLECIDRLSQQLEHMKYLEAQHGFKISLAVFTQETPAAIAMSMLDRCAASEMVPTEMKQHIVPYLRHCNQAQDAVLVEYINEALESAPTTTSTSEQARLIAIIDEIIDVELRASAAKLFFGSLVPPFSPHVKQFTRRCTKWDTRQIDVIQEHVRLMEIQDMLTRYGVARYQVGDARGGSRLVSHILAQIARESAFTDALQLVSAYSHLTVERAALEYFENMLTLESSTMGVSIEQVASRRSSLIKSAVKQLKSHYASAGTAWRIVSVLEETAALGLHVLEMKEAEEEMKNPRQSRSSSSVTLGHDVFLRVVEDSFEVFISEIDGIESSTADEKWGNSEGEDEYLLSTKLLSDIQRIRRMHAEWGILVSIKTVRNPDRVSERVRAFIQPDAMFSGVKLNPVGTKSLHSSLSAGKGKKRALGSANANDAGGAAKKAKSGAASGISLQESDEQQDDRQTKLAFDVHRYAAHMGMSVDDYHSLVAQAAAEHGDIIRAVQYSRDLFSRRRGVTGIPSAEGEHGGSTGTACASGLALKNISLSISKYTAMNTEEIYNLAIQGHGNDRRTLTPIQLARMQAPVYSLELLRYAICFCDMASFEETFLLLKNAMLSNDILKFTELGSFCGGKRLDEDKLRIYDRWFREESLCVLPGAQTMNLATRFAIAEHRLLVAHSDTIPIGVIDLSASMTAQDFLASKRLVSFLVENNADLLSIQVILSMRWIPEEARKLVPSQEEKLISTVFQSRNIDSFLALGLMLAMDQRNAFTAFRGQLSRENVAKDFNRFQRLAKIGSDAARAWPHLAFYNQCVELEGNARWWHFLNLLEIECDQKAFLSERRDLNYIRSLVPTLLAKSSFDYYTIQEFTRHYQIEDSFPALVYVEALLTVPEATAKSLEYRDKIVGVLEDIHQQQLVKLLLKTLPKVSGTDYDRLLFMFQLLLEHTSYEDKEEVERRLEVLHVLKAYASSDRGSQGSADTSMDDNTRDSTASAEAIDAESSRRRVCFHRIMTKPRDVLSDILTTRSFAILSNLDYPLRLESDELLMLLLKNVIRKHRDSEAGKTTAAGTVGPSARFSGSELERLFSILTSLKAAESKITAGEWLAEHLPMSTHKLRSLEFALEAAATSSSDIAAQRREIAGNVTFIGTEALTRLEEKVLRTKLQLVLAESDVKVFADPEREASFLKAITKQPKEVFYEVYRVADTSAASGTFKQAGHDNVSLHKIADRVASVLNLRANELRIDLIRELLVRDAVYGTQQKKQDGLRKPSPGDSSEAIFSPLDQEQRDARDEQLIGKISSIAVYVAQESQKSADTTDAVALVEYLVKFARNTNPRAGATFRAKLRAARAVLHLAQSHRPVVVAAVEVKMELAAFDVVIKELVDYIRHCQHMIIFEENRVPYEIGFVMRAQKEALVRSLLRQHSGREAWVLRCVANLMLDFDVQASDLWEFVLTAMKQQKMFRSLSRVLNGLCQHDFVRSINGASDCWEAALLSPLLYLKSLRPESGMDVDDSSSSTTPSSHFHGILLDNIRCELELMVSMLQRCPFLEQIDVASFVVHLRDIQMDHSNSTLSREVDLFAYAVRCAMVIPRPSARMEALQRIIQSGAYMQVLTQVCDASVFSDEPDAESSETSFSDHVSEQLAILEAIFREVLKRDDHEQLLGSPFEHGFLEFLALTGTIDRALALMLTEKRLEAASTLVELYYESNPERAPPGWSITEPSFGDASANGGRWSTLQQYVASSTSSHLATYRQMTA